MTIAEFIKWLSTLPQNIDISYVDFVDRPTMYYLDSNNEISIT